MSAFITPIYILALAFYIPTLICAYARLFGYYPKKKRSYFPFYTAFASSYVAATSPDCRNVETGNLAVETASLEDLTASRDQWKAKQQEASSGLSRMDSYEEQLENELANAKRELSSEPADTQSPRRQCEKEKAVYHIDVIEAELEGRRTDKKEIVVKVENLTQNVEAKEEQLNHKTAVMALQELEKLVDTLNEDVAEKNKRIEVMQYDGERADKKLIKTGVKMVKAMKAKSDVSKKLNAAQATFLDHVAELKVKIWVLQRSIKDEKADSARMLAEVVDELERAYIALGRQRGSTGPRYPNRMAL